MAKYCTCGAKAIERAAKEIELLENPKQLADTGVISGQEN